METGKRTDRPELLKALALCRQHKATLIIANLHRLARNTDFIANLMESGVDFVACDMPEANKLTLHIMAAMAEHAREAASLRTQEALTAAKARGRRLGCPTPNIPAINAAWSSQARHFREGVYPIAKRLRDRGLTLREITQEMNERGIKTCKNRRWHAASVGCLVKSEAQSSNGSFGPTF